MIDYNDIIKRGNQRLTLNDCQLLYHQAIEINAKSLLEIGSMDGTSSIILGLIAKKFNGRLICLEPYPKGRWFQNIREYRLDSYITLIKKASPWVSPTIMDLPIDFLFIDGDHRTRWILVDYHYWFPYVRSGGYIAFHDYYGGKGVKFAVQRAIDIILEDDKDMLQEIEKTPPASDRGTILFKKII